MVNLNDATKLQALGEDFLLSCQSRGLSELTLKAYRISLRQFFAFLKDAEEGITEESVMSYISSVQANFKQATANQKIAVLSLFLDFLAERRMLPENPIKALSIKQRKQEASVQAVGMEAIAAVLQCAYHEKQMAAPCGYSYMTVLRDVAVLELLFLSGMRVSELCRLRVRDVDLKEKIVSITGHGNRERTLRIDNEETVQALLQYQKEFWPEMVSSGWYFVNRLGRGLSVQSVRNMVKHYAEQANVGSQISPKVLRDSVAAALAEEGMDMVSLQRVLGHSSILTTQKYSHANESSVNIEKFHPRKQMKVGDAYQNQNGDVECGD